MKREWMWRASTVVGAVGLLSCSMLVGCALDDADPQGGQDDESLAATPAAIDDDIEWPGPTVGSQPPAQRAAPPEEFAEPDDVCSVGVVCGTVNNLTNNQIRIKALEDGRVETLGPGGYSRFVMRDVDQFTFPGTGFYIGVSHYSRGTWYTIHNGENAHCTKVPPFEPVCVIRIGL